MQFAFTSEQHELRAAVRTLLADRCTPADIRRCWGPESSGYDVGLWRELAEMGVLGTLADTDSGGLDLSFVDLVTVLEESGRSGLPGPLVEHAAMAVPALRAAGPDFAAETERAVAGELVVTGADADAPVSWAEQAGLMLLARDGQVWAVDPAEAALSPRRQVDASQRSADVVWTTGRPLVGVQPQDLFDRAVLGVAAQLLGLTAHMLDLTVTYVGQRRQFGVPIGSFQAVKHQLADARVALEFARPPVYRAAYAVAHDEPYRSRDCSFAKVVAARAANVAGRAALQCHGAIGYTFEHDLHLWLKRTWVLETAFGTTAVHQSRVADAVLPA